MSAERMRAIILALLARRLPATLVVATGRNHDLAAQLADVERATGAALRVLGLQPSLDPLIAASELVIGKAGGLTVSEVLARGVPMFIPLPVPGQEEWNVAHVAASGAGKGYTSPAAMAGDAVALLRNQPLRAAMAAAARAAGRPAAASAVAVQTLADLQQRRAEARPRAAATFRHGASVSSL